MPCGTGYIRCVFQINEGMMLYPCIKHHPDRTKTQMVGTWLDEDDKHNGVGFVEISTIVAMQHAFFFDTKPFV